MFFFYDYISRLNNKESTPLQVKRLICIQHREKRTSQSVSEEGSVTVEAAMIFPLLLCAFLAILMWGRVFLLHHEVETALLETARQIARQEHLLTEKEKEGIGILAAGLLFDKNREQGDGAQGLKINYLHMFGSEYREEERLVCLKVHYQIEVPLFLLGTWKVPFEASVIQKAWNGYVPEPSVKNIEHEYVYITEHGEVYHTNSQCYHLHVTVEEQNNVAFFYQGRSKFRPCEYCVEGAFDKQVLYTTRDGECYHEDLACKGLTRTVKYVELEKVKDRSLCADCAATKN